MAKKKATRRKRKGRILIEKGRKVRKIAPKETFAKKSFRTIQTPKGRLIIGCPKGEWDEKRQVCRVGTRAHKLVYNPKKKCYECAECPLEKTRLKRARKKKETVKRVVRRIIKKAGKKNPKDRSKWYVGYTVSPPQQHIIFSSTTIPTPETHGKKYGYVTGPFRTKQGALMNELHARRISPHAQTVVEAERLAKAHPEIIREYLKTRKNPCKPNHKRSNPKRRTSKVSPAALRMFRKIHGCNPDKIVKVGGGDENLIVLGEVMEIAYRVPFPTKRDTGDTEWVHKFRKKPILALTTAGKPCILFMKDHKITERGLIG